MLFYFDTLAVDGSGWKLTRKDGSYRKFDSGGVLTRDGDPAGNEIVMAYTMILGMSRLTSVTDAAGRALTFSFDGETGLLMSITAPLSRTWSFSYDANNSLASVSDPLGNSTGITYDSAGRIAKVTDPLSHGYDIAYTNGLVSTVTNPSPFQAQYQSFGYGDDTQTTFTQSYRDRRGKYWYYTFTNPGANLTTFKNPLNQTQNWTFDSSHNRLT